MTGAALLPDAATPTNPSSPALCGRPTATSEPVSMGRPDVKLVLRSRFARSGGPGDDGFWWWWWINPAVLTREDGGEDRWDYSPPVMPSGVTGMSIAGAGAGVRRFAVLRFAF